MLFVGLINLHYSPPLGLVGETLRPVGPTISQRRCQAAIKRHVIEMAGGEGVGVTHWSASYFTSLHPYFTARPREVAPVANPWDAVEKESRAAQNWNEHLGPISKNNDAVP